MNARTRTTACVLMVVAIAGCVDLHLFSRSVKNNVGQMVPKLELTFVDGKPAPVGKPLILEFWATWCEPCRDSLPHLNELYKTYKDQGLEIVGITKDDEATIKTFTKDVPIDFRIAMDPSNAVAGIFGITTIPHTLVVDKTGKIVWEGHPSTLQPGDIESVLH